MAKDPAFLFYYQDFLVGTDHFTNEETGAYIRCLCHQAHKGVVSEKHMLKICIRQDVQKTVKSKFKTDGNGNLFNEKLNEVIERRRQYSESRRKNRAGSRKKGNNICKTYVSHMENENETITTRTNNKGKRKFKAPLLTEVEAYFAENGYTQQSAKTAWQYYEDGNPPWTDSKGNQIRSWKQKMRGVWFKPENEVKEQRLYSEKTARNVEMLKGLDL